jgi:hypothetical protein
MGEARRRLMAMESNGMPQQIALKPSDIFLFIKVEDGQTKVFGVINDKGLSYQLLELARDAIYEHSKRMESLIQPASRLPGENPGL